MSTVLSFGHSNPTISPLSRYISFGLLTSQVKKVKESVGDAAASSEQMSGVVQNVQDSLTVLQVRAVLHVCGWVGPSVCILPLPLRDK